MAGLGWVVCAAPDVAIALGYDIQAALEEPDDYRRLPTDRGSYQRTAGGAETHPNKDRPTLGATPGVFSGASAKGVDMATCDQPGEGWTVVLRRQPTRIVEGRPEGGYTGVFEIICCDCGDDPNLDYYDVSPRLQLIRGPYPISDGVTAYEQHIELHQRQASGHHVQSPKAATGDAQESMADSTRL